MKIQLWRCNACNLVFGTDVAQIEDLGFDEEAPCCPNLTCRDNEWVAAVGAQDGYEVPLDDEDGDDDA